jgi:hypothetical protein
MRKGILASTALAMGLMASPEGLALFGNAMGSAGRNFLLAIFCGGATHLMTVMSLRARLRARPGRRSEGGIIEN